MLEAEANSALHPRDLLAKEAFSEAKGLFASPHVPLEILRDHMIGSNWVLTTAALAGLIERDDRAEALDFVQAFFDSMPPWAMYYGLKYYLTLTPRPPAGRPLSAVRDWWPDNMYLVRMFREHFDERAKLGDASEFGPALTGLQQQSVEHIKTFLARISHPYAGELIGAIDNARQTNVDRAFLTSVGRFWAAGAADALVEPDHWSFALQAAKTRLLSAQFRPLLTAGEARTGKTSFLRLLAARLERKGWTVFEASGADLMAGQQWFGQLEGRIQKLVEELAVTKQIVWYIPDIVQLAMSGTHQGQTASILDQILPAIASGRLVVWSETTPSGLAKLLRLRPGLRNTFEVAQLEPMSPEDTLELSRDCASELMKQTKVQVDTSALQSALDAARQYLTTAALPGSALDLLRLSVARAVEEKRGSIDAADVARTVAQLTGLPVSILDPNARVDLNAVRQYFAMRVIGQDEAVETLVARIAMLKAGLNDPGKPIGVFLFAGPTGTGKTEIAKTVAEYLFGSQDRLIRLDMSEFQTPDSTIKILGSGDAALPSDSLITRVRKQPFSVVLLDEFEKAHANVWDLFLQVFDDGRLSDQLGQVADFRHCIIILTSNLGATSHRSARLGFAPSDDVYTNDQVLRAVSQTFRPEFQNRLDKIIVFNPLSREVMRGILRKELDRILDRRGLKDRVWAVEWEASALEFLLEKGFSPEMGARPLKRAIEQYLVAPLAATIVEKRFPEGDQFVFVRSDGNAIQAEFVDPDADERARGSATEEDDFPALALMILEPAGSDAELHALEAEMQGTGAALQDESWEQRKVDLAAKMQAADFWSSPARFPVLAQLALIDRVQAAAETATSLKSRLDKGTLASGRTSRELISRLALQLYVVGEGIKDVREEAVVEVALAIEAALEKPGEDAAARLWCDDLRTMYLAWARKRHMQVRELPGAAGPGRQDGPILVIAGFGAARLLLSEQGLHVLDRDDDDAASGRATARVRVAKSPLRDMPPAKLREELNAELARAPTVNTVVRRYRSGGAPLVRDVRKGWRSGRLDLVLGGDFDLAGGS